MNIVLIILAILIIIIVMLQAKWAGLSIVQWAEEDFGKFERRGPEKVLFQLTIVLIVAFVALAIVSYLFA